MSISVEAASYLRTGMGLNSSGDNLISAIENKTALNSFDFIRLEDATEPDVAANIQACILGTYALSARDVFFLQDGFSLPVSALANVLANLAGGIQNPVALINSIVNNISIPVGFSVLMQNMGPANQEFEYLTMPAGSAFPASGVGAYFELFTGGNTNKYDVWFNVSNGNTAPVLAGFSPIMVPITAAMTSAQVAAALQAALSAVVPPVGGFALLANSTITNTGASVITGDVGLTPGSSITSGGWTLNGTEYVDDATAVAAQNAAQSQFTSMQTQGLAGTTIPSELGGQTLTPGAYQFASGSAGLSLTSGHSTLTFNGAGTYIIYTASTLLTGASGSTDVPTMVLEGGATAANIWWIVGSSATINQSTASAGATFKGNVIADVSITLTQSSIVDGSLAALTGAITISAASTVTAPVSSPGSNIMADASASVSGSVVTVVQQLIS